MIFGCDYSTKAIHIAWKNGHGQWFCYVFTLPLDRELLQELKEFIDSHASAMTLCIERPWSRYNAQTALKLNRVATAMEVLAMQSGVEVQWVATHAWRSYVFGKGRYTRAVAKRLAVDKARELSGNEVDDNTADAMCIALYGSRA